MQCDLFSGVRAPNSAIIYVKYVAVAYTAEKEVHSQVQAYRCIVKPKDMNGFTMNQESLCAKWLQCGNYRHRWYRIYTATIYTDANRRVKVGPTFLCIPPLFSAQPPPHKDGQVIQTSLELAITKENSERGDFSLLSSSFSWHEPLQISSSDGLRPSCVPCTWSKENTARAAVQESAFLMLCLLMALDAL
ncbi:hypothetical protein MG293_004395 [Ovis ammon polii]|uniref:Uncharacterized protein n=1 Tax=Ovis ammon polii TaxID=230172 RepID=A0AAD4UI22_OVIAM|nr:hypothetical protein MG293_004395 [Ovis ammon polii]